MRTRKNPTGLQSTGGQFTGTRIPDVDSESRSNGLQPQQAITDLSPAQMRQLIVRTGQDIDPLAPARMRNFFGQAGQQPIDPPAPRYSE